MDSAAEVELSIEDLTVAQLRNHLKVRDLSTVGNKQMLQNRLENALCGKVEEPILPTLDVDADDIDSFTTACSMMATVGHLRELISIVRNNESFGAGHGLAVSALAHSILSIPVLSTADENDRYTFLYDFEECNSPVVDDGAMMSVKLADLVPGKQVLYGKYAKEFAADIIFLESAAQNLCRDIIQAAPLKLQEYAKLAQPLKLLGVKTPTKDLLPLMVALRNSCGVDATPECGATPEERREARELEGKFGEWIEGRPWAASFMERPFVLLVDSAAVTFAPLAAITAAIPARFGPPPIDPADGAVVPNLVRAAGNQTDARWMGDLLRTHDFAPGGGQTYRIVSFSSTPDGIQFH